MAWNQEQDCLPNVDVARAWS
uniref:Uncharacterized protein n=1 Tax=Anguilla anguilla TaxID=7936 RepID=A0A0E9TI09_ANGAN